MIASALTCAAVVALFAGMRSASARLGNPPWASPVLLSALVIIAGLALIGRDTARFLDDARPLRWLLGPALVAMASIIHGNRAILARNAWPTLAAVGGGALVGLGSAMVLAHVMGLPAQVQQALSVKSVTAPFVVAIIGRLDGPVGLAAALSVLNGVIGALLVAPCLARLRLDDPAGRGLAMGVSSHIVGTDWLTRRDPQGGALSALALVLVGLVAALLVPLAWPWLGG